MNLEEMNRLINEAYDEFLEKKHEIRRTYAEERNPVKVGDTICDNNTTIVVEEMDVNLFIDSAPEMMYKGVELRKDGKPKSRQVGVAVFQSCVKLINGKPYKPE